MAPGQPGTGGTTRLHGRPAPLAFGRYVVPGRRQARGLLARPGRVPAGVSGDQAALHLVAGNSRGSRGLVTAAAIPVAAGSSRSAAENPRERPINGTRWPSSSFRERDSRPGQYPHACFVKEPGTPAPGTLLRLSATGQTRSPTLPLFSRARSPVGDGHEDPGARDGVGLLGASMVIESMIAWSSARSAAVARPWKPPKKVNRLPSTSMA